MNSLKCSLVVLLFSNLGFVIFSVMGILRLGRALFGFCCDNDGDFFRQMQQFRRLLRRVLCSPWKNVSSQFILDNLEILWFVEAMWVAVCGSYSIFLLGLVGIFWLGNNQSLSSVSFLIMEQIKVSATNPSSTPNTPKRSISAIFFVFGVQRVSLSLVLDLVCMVISLVLVLVLPVLDVAMKTKTATTLSRLSTGSYSTSTVTTSPTPSQPDTIRYRHLKTDSDYYRYLRHLGYYLRHFGSVLDTVTTSWVIVTLIALGNLNFKNSSTCYLHDLKNIGLDSIQSSLCALTHPGFACKISLALFVWYSPLREGRFSEIVFRPEGIDLIGKNWWRYYNMYDRFIILNNHCKVYDYLNRFNQYML